MKEKKNFNSIIKRANSNLKRLWSIIKNYSIFKSKIKFKINIMLNLN